MERDRSLRAKISFLRSEQLWGIIYTPEFFFRIVYLAEHFPWNLFSVTPPIFFFIGLFWDNFFNKLFANESSCQVWFWRAQHKTDSSSLVQLFMKIHYDWVTGVFLSDHSWGYRATHEAALCWKTILPESLAFLHILQQRHWLLLFQIFFTRYLYHEQLRKRDSIIFHSRGPACLLIRIQNPYKIFMFPKARVPFP